LKLACENLFHQFVQKQSADSSGPDGELRLGRVGGVDGDRLGQRDRRQRRTFLSYGYRPVANADHACISLRRASKWSLRR
jgi:hypothetical protein